MITTLFKSRVENRYSNTDVNESLKLHNNNHKATHRKNSKTITILKLTHKILFSLFFFFNILSERKSYAYPNTRLIVQSVRNVIQDILVLTY